MNSQLSQINELLYFSRREILHLSAGVSVREWGWKNSFSGRFKEWTHSMSHTNLCVSIPVVQGALKWM